MKTVKLVGEIGINANGDIGLAKKLIDAAVLSGCDFVKFQKRDIDLVYTKAELDKPRKSPWGDTNRAQKEGLEFGLDEYTEIDAYCKEKGISWFASPWDLNSVEFLKQFNPEYIKVASASLTDARLLKAVKATGAKIILSTGMSTMSEVAAALKIVGDQTAYILSCTSSYPTPIEDMNMQRINTLKDNYEAHRIGFSNHYPGIVFIIMAYVMGAKMIEYHITLDRAMYGSDQAASIELPGMLKIKDYLSAMEASQGSGNVECLPSEVPVKEKLRK